MATAMDIKAAAVVQKLLAKFGVDATVKRLPTGGTYNPDIGAMEGGSVADDYGVRMTPPADLTENEFKAPFPGSFDPGVVPSGDAVRRAKFTTYVQAAGIIEPKSDMRLLFDAKVYQIVAVAKIYSGENVALYQVWLND